MDDRVVKEIPVYLSKNALGQLYLLQQPLKPATTSFDDENIAEVRIKPELNKLQIKIEMDQNKEFYDARKGKALAEQASGGDDEGRKRRPMIHNVLESTDVTKLSLHPHHVVALIKKDGIHLSPIKSILQLKPEFPHLNEASKLQHAAEVQAGGTETESEEEEAQKIHVKFSRASAAVPKNPDSNRTTRASFAAARRKEAEEPWVNLTFCPGDPDEYAKLFTTDPENEDPLYVLNSNDYVRHILPERTYDAFKRPPVIPEPTPASELISSDLIKKEKVVKEEAQADPIDPIVLQPEPQSQVDFSAVVIKTEKE